MSNHTIETEDQNERVEEVNKPEDAANIIKEYEEILRTERKGIITVAYHQGKISRFKIHKNTIVFKINVFKLIEKHPGLMKSSVTLSFLKNYFNDIKRIYQQNLSEFD